jgi:hypothetical protein
MTQKKTLFKQSYRDKYKMSLAIFVLINGFIGLFFVFLQFFIYYPLLFLVLFVFCLGMIFGSIFYVILLRRKLR